MNKLFATGAACLFSITGCSSGLAEESIVHTNRQVLMDMLVLGSETRADYTDDGSKMSFSWREGDAISVLMNDIPGNENSKLATSVSGKRAPFSGKVLGWTGGSKTVYAFYPYSSTAYNVVGGDTPEVATTSFTLANPQTYTIGSAINNSLMVGVGRATAIGETIAASANMKQVMSIIKLEIANAPGKVKGVKLKCAEATFPTTATVTLGTAEILAPSNLVNELSMTVTDNTEKTVKSVSFAIFPADFTGKKIRIEVTFENGKSKVIEKDGENFVRNMHYVMAFDGSAPYYFEVNGVKVATGNLIADGSNDAKIGEPTDGGLFFQFGSLVGWSSTGSAAVIAVKPTKFNGGIAWADSKKIWRGRTDVPFTLADSDEEKAGVGDPCQYYLKGTWRLPRKEELMKLFKNSAYPVPGPWAWAGSSILHTSGTVFSAAGRRQSSNGTLAYVGGDGYYWSASSATEGGYHLFFYNTYGSPNSLRARTYGFPVRCVQD